MVENGRAFAIFRIVIFWNDCVLFQFDYLADPHCWIPCVRMGFRRDLNISNFVINVENLFFENYIFKDPERTLCIGLFFFFI